VIFNNGQANGSSGIYGGTQKCGRANVLGHERMNRAYAETYDYHMYEQSFSYLR